MKKTDQIRLRALLEKDMMTLHKWINDPDVIQYTNVFRPISEMEQKEWFYSLHKNKSQHVFAIELKAKDRIIGTCGLYDIDPVSRKAELRIKIGEKEYWGHGVGTSAVKRLVEFGFASLNLNKIWLKVMKDNARAVKSYEKSGFMIEGELKQDMFINGEYKDVLLMASIKK